MAFLAIPQSFWSQLQHAWFVDFRRFLHVGLPKLIVIVLGAWILILLVNYLTRRVSDAAERTGSGSARAAQVHTFTSVIRASGIAIVIFLAVLQTMKNVLNLNLGPLLMSAGVSGIAIGLAAQTLVKDIINGFFILTEDQYTVGEVVTLAGLTGTVDSMTLRKTRLLGFDGTIYTIPNSQITTVANQSRDFSQTTLEISVDFSANPDDVVPLLTEIAMSVRNDPKYSHVFMQDPTVLGVDSIKGSEVIYPIVVKTRARKQYDALREMQRRIRLGLEQNHMLPGSPYRLPTQVSEA